MKKQKHVPTVRGRRDTEFGFDLTPDIIDGINTMSHPRSDAVWQQTHAAPRNNTRPGEAANDDFEE